MDSGLSTSSGRSRYRIWPSPDRPTPVSSTNDTPFSLSAMLAVPWMASLGPVMLTASTETSKNVRWSEGKRALSTLFTSSWIRSRISFDSCTSRCVST